MSNSLPSGASQLAIEAIVAHTETNSAEHQYMLYLLRRAEDHPARLAPALVSVEANLCAIIARRGGAR